MNLQHRCQHISTCHMAVKSHFLISSTQQHVLSSTVHEPLGYAVFDNPLSRPPSCPVKLCHKPHYNNTQLVWRLKLDTLKGATLKVLQLQRGYLMAEVFMDWANVVGKCIAGNLNTAPWNIELLTGNTENDQCAGARYIIIFLVCIHYIICQLQKCLWVFV